MQSVKNTGPCIASERGRAWASVPVWEGASQRGGALPDSLRAYLAPLRLAPCAERLERPVEAEHAKTTHDVVRRPYHSVRLRFTHLAAQLMQSPTLQEKVQKGRLACEVLGLGQPPVLRAPGQHAQARARRLDLSCTPLD